MKEQKLYPRLWIHKPKQTENKRGVMWDNMSGLGSMWILIITTIKLGMCVEDKHKKVGFTIKQSVIVNISIT